MFPKQFHHWVYFTGLVLVAISLPYSMFTLSVAQITLAVNWALEGEFKAKWARLKEHPSIWIISVLYLVHLLWMAGTTDFDYGLSDLRIKLPMFALPLIIGTSPPLQKVRFKVLLNLFSAAVFVATVICAFQIWGFNDRIIVRDADFFPYVSHIRLSLMVVLAVFTLGWLFTQSQSFYRWLYVPVVLWLVLSLIIIRQFTGIVIFIVIVTMLMCWGAWISKNLMARWFLLVSLATMTILITSYITHAYSRFFTFDKVNVASLEKYTANGNEYQHDPSGKAVENGHFIDLYICDTELRKSWKTKSQLDFDGTATNGGSLRAGLIRYLTAKGLRKDSAGFSQLTTRDIKYIEAGVTNYIDTVRFSLYPKLYVTFWELYNYKNGGNPTGCSISQRLEFLKTASHIIAHNKWFGVGTGDVPKAFDDQYKQDNSPLAPTNRFRTHNQWFTFTVAFGIIGILLIILSLTFPPILEKKYSNFLFIIIFVVGLLSFFTEDTLETHQGVSFFAFFYSLFLFRKDEEA